jgi:hypothetical protein
MNTTKNRVAGSTLQIPVFVGVWFVLVYVVVGRLALAYIPLFVGGFVFWRLTTYRAPIEPERIIVPYLVTVIMFIVHVYDEYTSHQLGFTDITPLRASFEEMVAFAASLAPILWLLGAIMMLKHAPLGFFIASTFLFGMMFIEPSHFIAPFWPDARFHYVGGLWTAVLPTGMGWYTFLAIRREIATSSRRDQ